MWLLFTIVLYKGSIVYMSMDEKYPEHKCYSDGFRIKVELEQMVPGLEVRTKCVKK